jgi:hypothetical protein
VKISFYAMRNVKKQENGIDCKANDNSLNDSEMVVMPKKKMKNEKKL